MMKKLIVCTALALAFSVNALALEVPTDTVMQNLNGSQQVIKTYTLPPNVDPQELIEDPFELDGYFYSFADIVKTENHVEDVKQQTEIVTVETSKDDLSVILEQLSPTMDYDDGLYTGTLALVHTSIYTEAAGYTKKSATVTESKTIGPVDRNDMSYVPATTVKNGVTLNLASVDWQIVGTDLVGETLMPASYQAVATYTGKTYYSAATGYITTAEYVGEVTRTGVESITYTLTYLGTEAADSVDTVMEEGAFAAAALPYVLAAIGLAVVIILAVLLLRSRRETGQEQLEEDEYEQEDAE